MAAGSSDDQPAASGANDATDKSVTGRATVQSELKHACCFKVGFVYYLIRSTWKKISEQL